MATWFEITFTGEPTEADFARVSELAAQGCTSGQLLNDPGAEDEEGPATGWLSTPDSPCPAGHTRPSPGCSACEMLTPEEWRQGYADLAARRETERGQPAPIPEFYPGFSEDRRRIEESLARRYSSPEEIKAAGRESWTRVMSLFEKQETPASPPPRGCGTHHAGECTSEYPYNQKGPAS